MTFVPQNVVYVYYHGAQSKQLMGRLLLKNRQILFEYDPNFVSQGFAVSPFKLPLKMGTIPSLDRAFEGLFGIFNDSLPDGWGRLLLDRKLMRVGINPNMLSPLDRLCFVGSHGMGALSYEPENADSYTSFPTDLDEVDYEIQATLSEDNSYLDDLFALGGSSAGARPKILLRRDHKDWLIKFRSSLDPKDIGAIEYAYHLMAQEAGLHVPQAVLFPSKKGLGFFGVQRFDLDREQKIHMHTLSGLIHADHREPCLDYETIIKTTLYLTQSMKECETQFRNAVFNVLSHNRDDHAKNFSFLMDAEGVWRVSPAYDLTFSFGPGGEHSTMVMGEGKNPTREHLLALADVGNISKNRALEIIDQISTAILKWHDFALQSGVSHQQTKNITKFLSTVALK